VRCQLQSLVTQFQAATVPDPELSARYLVSHVLRGGGPVKAGHCDHHLDSRLSSQQKERLESLVMCRMARMPVQYILGNWDFHNITVDVRPPVFIPRPETEQLVDVVLDRLSLGPRHVLEVGPGCGAISLALLSARPDLTVTAVERTQAAVELTRHNAELLGLQDRLTVIHSRVEKVQLFGSYDAVVSNPPYVLRKDLALLQPEIHVYEDLRALDGGSEGLDVILPILELSARLLQDKESGFVALEVDPCHPHILPSRLDAFYAAETIKDFRAKDRFMVMRML
jgi:release factor glutamine methyltransferase